MNTEKKNNLKLKILLILIKNNVSLKHEIWKYHLRTKNIMNSKVFLKQLRLFKQLKVIKLFKHTQLEIDKTNPFLLLDK